MLREEHSSTDGEEEGQGQERKGKAPPVTVQGKPAQPCAHKARKARKLEEGNREPSIELRGEPTSLVAGLPSSSPYNDLLGGKYCCTNARRVEQYSPHLSFEDRRAPVPHQSVFNESRSMMAAQIERQQLLAGLGLSQSQGPAPLQNVTGFANPLQLRHLDSALSAQSASLTDQLRRLQSLAFLNAATSTGLSAVTQPELESLHRMRAGGGFAFHQPQPQRNLAFLQQSIAQPFTVNVADSRPLGVAGSNDAVTAALVFRLQQQHGSSGMNALYSGGLASSLLQNRLNYSVPGYVHSQGLPQFGNRAAGEGRPGGGSLSLPAILAQPEDSMKLSSHQVLLRHQIEAFRASEDDVMTHTRGRNKPVILGQVGIRCRHCAYLPVVQRQKGSTYFPSTMLGLYQAAQNMSTTHMQCGRCTEMPDTIKNEFARLISSKVASSGAGRPYWAESAKKIGLVDSDDGIRFILDVQPAGAPFAGAPPFA
jgi:hypothetical protein